MSERYVELPAQRGVLIASHSESHESRAVSLYGDSEGLRALGELLIAMADLDQSQFQSGTVMDEYGHHLHLAPKGQLHPQSLEIVIGRLDAIRGGKMPDWFQPALMKPVRPLRAILPKRAQLES